MEENLGRFYKNNPLSENAFLLGRPSLSISTGRGKTLELKELSSGRKKF